MKKSRPFNVTIVLTLFFATNQSVTIHPSSAAAPPPPPHSSEPARPPSESTVVQSLMKAPSPTAFPEEFDRVLARQAIEAVLEKNSQYWGPRYQVVLDGIVLEGSWAHATARWSSPARLLSGPIHLLARRQADGSWQALMPSGDGQYLEWLDSMPMNLLSVVEKEEIRTQAFPASALHQVQATPDVPDAFPHPAIGQSDDARAHPRLIASGLENRVTITWAIEGTRSVVYLVAGDGKRTKVVDVPFDEMWIPQFSIFITLSPNEHYVTYVTADGLGLRNADLWIIDLASMSRRILATFPDDLWTGPPVWSPDEAQLAIARVTHPPSTGSGIQLWSIDVATGAQDLVVSDPTFRPELFWSAALPVVRWSTDDGTYTYTDYAADEGLKTEYRVDLSTKDVTSVEYPLDTEEMSQLPNLASLPCGVEKFNQHDEPWGPVTMQPCGKTVADAGCAVTSAAMVFRYFGADTNPLVLTQCLNQHNAACDIVWGTASASCSSGKASPQGSAGFTWSQMEADLQQGRPPILQLCLNGDCQKWSHFVVVVSGSGSTTGGYTINDPFNGGVRSLADYDSWSRVGLRRYSGTPWCQVATCPQSGGVILYKHRNYDCGGEAEGSGYVMRSSIGWQNVPSPFNDQASSLRVPSGWSVRLYEHSDRAGSSVCRSGGDNDFAGDYFDGGVVPLNDRISSIEVFDNTNCGSGPPPSTGNWNARYYQGSTCWWDTNCSVTPQCTETIGGPELHKNWGSSAPCGGMSGDDWVGDFSGVINFPAGDYVFYLDNDDGAKLWLNGQNIQDRGSSNSGPVCPARHLSGDNQLRVLLREEGGDARVNLTWSTNTSICNPAPNPPSLQSPANGSQFSEGESITLCWSDTGDDFQGEVWGGPGGTLTFGWQSGTCKNLGSQWAGYAYSWHVHARNSAGTSGWSDTWGFTVRPAPPSNLSAQAASCNQVSLYWNDNSGNEESHTIYRNGSLVAQVGANVTSYQDIGVSEDTGYSYYVRSARGTIESYSSNTANVTTPTCAPPQPDLVPSQWGGWPYPIVPASIPGTGLVDTLLAGQPTYLDWGITNSGNVGTGGNTYGDLYIDGDRVAHYDFGDVQAGLTWAFFDWVETIGVPGWHTLRFEADPDNYVGESDESNNTWERQFFWIPSAPFSDDMESGISNWTATGLWHLVDSSSPYPEVHTPSQSWWYGQDATGNYDTGWTNSGDLTSPGIFVPGAGYYLRFWYWYEMESHLRDWDQRWLQISVDDGPFTNVLQLSDDPMEYWLQSPAIDLSVYAGHAIRVRFHFNSIDNALNGYRGWYVDDLSISASAPPSCSDSHEPNDSPEGATPIAYGQALTADLCPGGDYDHYTFTGLAGDKVVVDIDAKSSGSLLDSYVFLLGSDGQEVLAEHDDEITGELQDSHLGYQLPQAGTYYVKVKAWDHPSAGGADYFYTIGLLNDEIIPTAEITSPDHYEWLDSSLQPVTTSVSDGESGIRNVAFYWHDATWDGSTDWVVLQDDYDPRDGWTFNLDTSTIPEQSQDGVVFIYAYDWAGNYAGYGSYFLGLDRTAPVVAAEVHQMYDDAPFRDFWVTWYGGFDNLSGIASYDVQHRDGADGTWTDLVVDSGDSSARFVGLDSHTYYFQARALDNAGNQGAFVNGDGDVRHMVQTCSVLADPNEGDDAAGSARWVLADAPPKVHNFHTEGDQDWVRFFAAAGITYTIATTSGSSHADTVVYLYQADGTTLIDYNDDYPDLWPFSRLDWIPSTSGTYLVKVVHWDPWAYGCTTEYNLSITGSDVTPVSQVFLPLVLCNR